MSSCGLARSNSRCLPAASQPVPILATAAATHVQMQHFQMSEICCFLIFPQQQLVLLCCCAHCATACATAITDVQVIADITRRMGSGMAKYIERDVESVEDYDEYCHFVAGLVGIGLSQVLAAYLNSNSHWSPR